MFRRLDRTIAALYVTVVSLDCFLGDLSRVSVLVVDVCHHLCCDPHFSPVVDPPFCAHHCHQQQRNRCTQAVPEVRIVELAVPECLASMLEPSSVVNIVGVELLQHELVPSPSPLV